MPLVTDAMLAQARAWQASIMTDTVTLEACTGETLDDWGTATPVWSEVYAGPGLVQVDTTRPAVADSAGRPMIVQEYVAKLPHSVILERGTEHRVRVAASKDAGNQDIYTVIADETQGWATCRRLRMVRST